jgi:hypothetical protein
LEGPGLGETAAFGLGLAHSEVVVNAVVGVRSRPRLPHSTNESFPCSAGCEAARDLVEDGLVDGFGVVLWELIKFLLFRVLMLDYLRQPLHFPELRH